MPLPKPLHLDDKYADRIVSIPSSGDIPQIWKNTPIENLILAENFGRPIPASHEPQMLIATCIEFRYSLPIPSMYAYVIRRASGRLIGSEFSLAYILSRGVEWCALIGHNDCAMTRVDEHKGEMVNSLVNEGWARERAEEYVAYHAARYSIHDELDALEREYTRLKRLFKRLKIAPLFVCLSDTKLYIPKWYNDMLERGENPEEFAADPDVPDEELLSIM
jgi:carbonic anhydrase